MIITDENQPNIRFSDITQVHDLYYSTIIECRAKLINIYVKPISENEIAIYGDYRIIVLYRRLYLDEDKHFASLTINKNICEILPVKSTNDFEPEVKLILHPSSKFKYEKQDHGNYFWEICVEGEIQMSNSSMDTINNLDAKETDNFDQQNNNSVISDSNVWQFEENDDISIEQMMDMDLESLKNLKK